jgi:hypothetical protein
MNQKHQVRFQFRGKTKNNLFPECPQFDSSVDGLTLSLTAVYRLTSAYETSGPASEHVAAQITLRMACNLLQLKDRSSKSQSGLANMTVDAGKSVKYNVGG